MIHPIRPGALVFTVLALASASPTGLEARTHLAVQSQEAPPVRTPDQFYNYVAGEAQRLNQNKNKERNGKHASYDNTQYKTLIDEVLQYYKIPLSGAEIVESDNFFISPQPDGILIQCWLVPEPNERISNDTRINGIRISKVNAVLEGGVRTNGNYFAPIKLPYPPS